MGNSFTYFIVFLVSVMIGMIINIIFVSEYTLHGPNAINESKKVYYDIKNQKHIRFNIELISCPKTKLQKILSYLNRVAKYIII